MAVRRGDRDRNPLGGTTIRRRHPRASRIPRRLPSTSIHRWFPQRAAARSRSTRPVWHVKQYLTSSRAARPFQSRRRRNPRTRHGEGLGRERGHGATLVPGNPVSGLSRRRKPVPTSVAGEPASRGDRVAVPASCRGAGMARSRSWPLEPRDRRCLPVRVAIRTVGAYPAPSGRPEGTAAHGATSSLPLS